MDADVAVVIALGSNLAGDWESPLAVLRAAMGRLESAGLRPLAQSSWWRSTAWPDPNEPDYVNAVALVETDLTARDTLARLHGLERTFGRLRDGRPNAPRILDLDLIAYGRQVVDEGAMRLPHPRAAERHFVMGPLCEIAPDWRHPVSGATARELASRADIGGAEPIIAGERPD